jgi:cobyrinic acid a,c-diamide synthase
MPAWAWVTGVAKVLAVDLDGVIHWYRKGWQEGVMYDPPSPGAIPTLMELQHRGYHLIVLTARAGEHIREAQTWLLEHWQAEQRVHVSDRCFDVAKEHPVPQITNQKPGAIAYIDDRAFKFVDWEGVLDGFKKP